MMEILVVPTDAHKVKGPRQGQWTSTDWERLPEDGNRYEVIDGVLYMSTSPSSFHQWIILQFYDVFGYSVKQHKLAYIYLAPIGVFMPGCEPVQPDFVLVRAANASIIHDRRIYGVPDLIVEVLSPSNADYDEGVKLAAYAKAGVPDSGVIDPAARQLRLYAQPQGDRYGDPHVFKEGDTVIFACAPGISVNVRDLFTGSPDTTL